jgi:phage N-6-adenine-methyltransferase
VDAYAKSKTPKEARDRRATPPSVFHRIEYVTGLTFMWDACAETHTSKVPGRCWTKEDDALSIDWHKALTDPSIPGHIPVVWMNPPYSNPDVWCAKAVEEAAKGLIVMGLLPDDRSTGWYLDHVEDVASVCWVPDKRISFHDEHGVPQDGNPKGSALPLWTPWRTRHTTYTRFNLEGSRTKPLVIATRDIIIPPTIRRIRRK